MIVILHTGRSYQAKSRISAQGACGTDACGDGHRPALLAQHAVGRQPQGRVPLHAARRHRHRPGLQDLPAAPDGGRNEFGVRGGRWPPGAQVRPGAAVHREPDAHAPVVLPAAVLAPAQPGRAGLGACQTTRQQPARRIQGRNEAAGSGRLAPNPEAAEPGQIVLRA